MSKEKRHTLVHYLIVILLGLAKHSSLGILFLGIGYLGCLLFERLPSPVNLVAGLALVIIGISMVVVNLWEIWMRIISRDYNLGHCPFCPSSKDPKKILFEKNG
jgi:predicted membrane protein